MGVEPSARKRNIDYWVESLQMPEPLVQEGGGHQNEQINQLIKFISVSETNPRESSRQPSREFYFSYVAFWDGWYFNRFRESCKLRRQQPNSKISPKIASQRKDIIDKLEKNHYNYFVNTHGFWLLLKDSLPTEVRNSLPETFSGGN
ncbi:MAG: hypothetical protein ACK4ME_10050 [Fimbriimonadales bacterium]